MRHIVRILSAAALAVLPLLAGCPGALPDEYEPNDALASAYDLGEVLGNEPEHSWSATISPKGDVDFYALTASEGTGIGMPFAPERFTFTLRLVPPQAPDARDYDLYVYDLSGTLIESSRVSGAAEETIDLQWDGTVGADDSVEFRVEVRSAGHDASPSPYALYAALVETSP
jgi:hypothetical protein